MRLTGLVSGLPLILLIFLVFAMSCTGSGKERLPVTRDMVVWMYRGEPTFNFGAVEPLWVEGAHYAALLDFDVARARGKKINSARLWLHQEGDSPLYSLVVSTVGAGWIEGAGDGTGSQNDASCAAWVRLDPVTGQPVRWAGPGSDITDVIMSQGNTIRSEQPVRRESGGWQSVAIPEGIMHDLVNGGSHGLALVDARGELRHPDGSFVYKRFNSRDSREYAPYIEVELEDAPPGAPHPPAEVRIEPAIDRAGLQTGAIRLIVSPRGEGEERGSFYQAVLSETPFDGTVPDDLPRLPRWLLPRIGNNSRDTITVTDLPPGARRFAAVRKVDRYGRESEWVTAEGIVSPESGIVSFTAPRRPDLGGRIQAWVCGPDEKVNPVNGRLLEENPGLYLLPGDGDYEYKYSGPLWDARASTVSLDVPRGGTGAFQVIVEPQESSLEGVSIRAEWIDNPAGVRSRHPVRLFRNWYLRGRDGGWRPEVAVPHEGDFAIPWTENAVPGQRNQAFLVEYYVPRDCPPGRYRAGVTVGARGLLSRTLRVEINVHRAALPDVLPFIAEMNVYGPFNDQYGLNPDSDEYYAVEEKYYRMAHEHLSVMNQLPYRQTGEIRSTGAPILEGEGESMRVADWSAWEKRWSRYLDGSAFEGTDRRAPVPVMYLPFHENWPSDLNRYYRFTPKDTTYPGMINERALKAPPLDEAFDQAYEIQWVNVLRQFADYFRGKGWTGTEFHVYLNNKYYWKDPKQGGRGVSWWLLDEPYHWSDFEAVGWFGRLFMQAVGEVRDVNFLYRIDVSRPQLQFGLWDGIRSVSYVSPAFYEKNAFLLDRKRRFGEEMRNYGAFNNLEETNLTATAWPLKVWLNHGSGLLPWQTIASDENFERFQNTAVFYPGLRFGIRGPLASLRLKACRLGVENAVLMEMLARRNGWSREQAAVAAAAFLNLGGDTVSRFFDDAGQVTFTGLDSRGMVELRRALLRSLE